MLPLDRFEVRNGQLVFEDLAVKHGFTQPRNFKWEWFRFDNGTGQRTPINGNASAALPSGGGEFHVAKITGPENDGKAVFVYLRGRRVVGIERTW